MNRELVSASATMVTASANDYRDLRDLMQTERTAIAGLCDEWQCVLNDSEKGEGSPIPDDVCGKIQIAIGQAQLLIKKKFEHFNNLIKSCEDNSTGKPVTVEDLRGFWEMINIQVADIHNKFSEITKLKGNNWEPLPSHEPERKPLGNLNKSTPKSVQRWKSAGVKKDISTQAKERVAQAKAMIRKRMEEERSQ